MLKPILCWQHGPGSMMEKSLQCFSQDPETATLPFGASVHSCSAGVGPDWPHLSGILDFLFS